MPLSKADGNVLPDNGELGLKGPGSPFLYTSEAPSVGASQVCSGVPELAPAQEETFPNCSQGGGGGTPTHLISKLERMGVTSHFSTELFDREKLWAAGIAAKLFELGRADLAAPVAACHTITTFAVCQSCHVCHTFLNHCDRFYCPLCQPRLAWHRRRSIEWWAGQVKEPKHLVLTVRNSRTLSKAYVQKFKTSLSQLRRSKLFRSVRAGLVSLEVTNEGRGWHLHSHLLLDGPFLDSASVARKWARLVKQDYAIVKIKDCREKSYLQEVTKYAVKGNELAAWNGSEIETFIDAFTGVRTFSTFGGLFKDNALRRKALIELSSNGMTCSNCGNYDFWFLDQAEHDYYDTTGKLPWNGSYTLNERSQY